MLKISVIIPVYNAIEDVKILLSSITKNFDFVTGEVIIIDDCSERETSDFLADFAGKNKKIKLLKNEENSGFIKSCNRGMREASGDITVLLNSDTEIPAGFNKKIIDCFNSNPKIGVASPISSHSVTYTISMPKGYNLQKMNNLLDKKHKASYPLIGAAEGFCFCIRKEVIESQGYLDEIYGKGYHEEVDYSCRAITNGWINVLIDNLYVYHKRHASFGISGREKLINQNNEIFYQRWAEFRRKYIKNNNLKNPVKKIYKKILPFKYLHESIKRNSKKLLSYKHNGTIKEIRILGLKLKFKNKIKQ